jgi:hypothetical protein
VVGVGVGGNPNPYTYPTDPINGEDITGNCWGCGYLKHHWHAIRKGLELAATAAVIGLACGATAVGCIVAVGAIAGGLSSGINYKQDHKKQTTGGFWSAFNEGAITGGVPAFGWYKATGGNATSGFQVGKQLIKNVFRFRSGWN